MSVRSMVELLDSTYEARDQIVPCMIGPVGIGKTAAVDIHRCNMSKKYNQDVEVITIIASQILPNEISGITMPDSDTKSMEIYDHFKLSHMKDGDILFFDELFEADQYVLSACLTLIESRMMMSGKKLPDIQIIAATNPTVTPSAIKPSIRQRFMFENFQWEEPEFRKYLHDKYNVSLTDSLVRMINFDSDVDYNFLTPRSLTKLVRWIMTAKTIEEAKTIKKHVRDMWSANLSIDLYNMWEKSYKKQENKMLVRDTLIQEFDLDIKDATLEEVIDVITKSGDWEKATKFLASQTLD